MKTISVVTGCFNEEDNVELLYKRLKAVFDSLPQYRFEIIFIDNASTDGTVKKLKLLAAQDQCVKVIVNMRNFGAIRSGYHAILQADGDAVVALAADLQDPPELINDFVKHWEAGELLIAAVKKHGKESLPMFAVRTLYYKLLNKMANVELIDHFTGFGLYDQCVIRELRRVDDRYPYLRGLISELGYPVKRVTFVQPSRHSGKTKSDWYHFYDLGMLGLTSHSIVPMRIATLIGFVLATGSLMVALAYFIYKLLHWSSFEAGMAPVLIGLFGLFSIQLMFIGLLGEYIGSAHRNILRRPLVVERERINFTARRADNDGATNEEGSESEHNVDDLPLSTAKEQVPLAPASDSAKRSKNAD